MASLPKPYITPEEYLDIERKSDYKSEYFDGEMVAMTGASEKHNLIVTNVIRELSLQLKDHPCRVYPSDMRVKIPKPSSYTYPDVVVVCEESKFDDNYRDTLLNPILVVEVLSESTESYDRGRKFIRYRRIESLMEYILIAQDDYRVEQFVRQQNNKWLLSEIQGIDTTVKLNSINSELQLREIYHKVTIDR